MRSRGFGSESVQCLRVYVRVVQSRVCISVCKLWMFFSPQLRVWKRIYVNVPVCATPRPGGISLHLKGRLCRLVCLLLRNVFFNHWICSCHFSVRVHVAVHSGSSAHTVAGQPRRTCACAVRLYARPC